MSKSWDPLESLSTVEIYRDGSAEPVAVYITQGDACSRCKGTGNCPRCKCTGTEADGIKPCKDCGGSECCRDCHGVGELHGGI